jgi:SAM-dependent methyltransferase
MPMKEFEAQLRDAKRTTKDAYERQARYWDQSRDITLYEKPWLDRFLSTLPAVATILDLGCGSGIPVSGYFLEQGHTLVGVDYSPTMIELARGHFPDADWMVQDMSQLCLSRRFDGICSWDGFFHLSIEEQRELIPQLCKLTRLHGAILLTVGWGEGEVTGTVGGETVYHASLAAEEYKDLFRTHGFSEVSYVPEDIHCQGRSVLLASGKTGV